MGTGNVTGGAVGSITVNTSQLQSAQAAVQSFASGVSTSLTGMNPSIQQAESGFAGLANVGRMVGITFAGVFTGATVKAGVELAHMSARSDQLAQRLGFLANIAGESSEKMLQSMREASRGHIADMDLMAAANRALLLGVVDSTEEIEELMRIAGARAGAMGITFTKAFDDMVSGIGRLSPMILDNLGILVNATQAYETYAAANGLVATELTETQRRQAFYNAIVAQSADLVKQHGDAGISAAGQFQVTKTAVDNLKVAFGQLLQPSVVSVMTGIAKEADGLRDIFQGLTKDIEAADAARRRFTGGGGGGGGDENWFTRDFLSEGIGWVNQQMNWGPNQLSEVEIEAKALNKELAETKHMLDNAERGLVSMQASAAAGLLDSAQVQAQIALVEFLTNKVLGLETAVANVGRGGSRGPNLQSVSGTVARVTASVFPKQEELEAAQVDYWQGIQAIDRQAHSAIQDATQQYGQQRASTVAQFEKSMAREAEDFGRQRARAVTQHERQIADIREAAAIREMTAISDLAERIAGLRLDAERRLADATEDFNERRAQQQATYEKRVSELREDGLASIAKIEETAQRERERALRAHRDTLLNAASRLDARAVAQEMRRFATANAEQERSQAQALKEAKENLAERLEQEKENHEERMAADQAAFDKRNAREARDLQRRIDAEQAAHEKRLADARAADEQRIAEQQEAFDRQLAQEDEDRAIRLARQRQDHADQLGEMARAQALRIQQIGEQQAEQRQKLNDEFEDQLADLGLFNRDRLTEQARFKRAATELWNDMWGDWYKTMADMHKAEREFAAAMGPHPQPLDYPSLNDPSSLPGGYNPAASTRTVNLSAGAIVVNEATRPGETAEEVLRIFERLAN